MDDATARSAVKIRLDIASDVTTFDDNIDEFVQSAVNRLAPIALKEVAPQVEFVSPDSYGEIVIDLSGLTIPLFSTRKVEVSSGREYELLDDTYHHADSLYLREVPQNVNSVKIFGLARYTLADIPNELYSPVIWFAMSEFYDFLAGNKRKYNIYMGNGARTVDNMRDESDVYEQKANDYLNDRVQLYGVH